MARRESDKAHYCEVLPTLGRWRRNRLVHGEEASEEVKENKMEVRFWLRQPIFVSLSKKKIDVLEEHVIYTVPHIFASCILYKILIQFLLQ
jgi:hypothetical protein